MRAACIHLTILLTAAAAHAACAQSPRADLYECEGCEAIHERPHHDLGWSAVVPPAGEPGERMVLSGRVFHADGKTPAAGVVIYVHHTNSAGVYPRHGNEQGWGRRHGYLRAWVKTNARGEYRFETIRPGSYPGRRDPAHIHFTIKEPNRREYWIDDVVFTDDPYVDAEYRRRAQNRGGSGIVTPVRSASGEWRVQRDIVLER
jgi:protocatechuate 3,4-dioxygenase, beta subunit